MTNAHSNNEKAPVLGYWMQKKDEETMHVASFKRHSAESFLNKDDFDRRADVAIHQTLFDAMRWVWHMTIRYGSKFQFVGFGSFVEHLEGDDTNDERIQMLYRIGYRISEDEEFEYDENEELGSCDWDGPEDCESCQ